MTSRMPSLLKNAIPTRLSLGRLFSDRPEESLRLRLLILMTYGWVALSLNWVTGSPWVPLAGAVLATAGHWVSWRWRRSPLGYRTIFIAVAVLGLSVAMRNDFVNALTGDRLPIAAYVLLVGAIASYGIRTRGGLYAQLILSGLVLFFVGEMAFDPAFVGFLIVFLGLFLTLAAMAFLEDQISIARVHWPEGQIGRFWFWLGIVGGGLLVCSALAFALMPPDYRGGPGSQRVGIVPFMGEAGGFGAAVDAPPDAFEPQGGNGRDPSGSRVTGEGFGESAPLRDVDAPGDQGFESRVAPEDARDVIMHVRSAVTSYWRGRIFDRFDGRSWFRSSDRQVVRAIPNNRNFYWHAFFLQQDQPQALFTGYNPIRILLPDEVRERGSLTQGSTYSALSQRPELTSRAVRGDGVGWKGNKYLALPDGMREGLQELADEIGGDASTPFERLWLVVSHLRQNHTYDVAASNQLALSGNVLDFLRGQGPGTSLDFAAATVLLARALDMPARLATGYLPGKFDPFSGTHKVRRRDTHAWAEINFARNGWVAFDGTPRPELDVFTSGDLARFGGTSFIFQTRVGGGLYEYLRSGASEAADQIASDLQDQAGNIAVAAAALGAIALGLAAYWLVRSRSAKRRGSRYSRLSGEGRRRLLKTYGRLERMLKRHGVERRNSSETFREHGAAAARRFVQAGAELEWFRNAAWVAVYDPAGPSSQLVREAEERLARLRLA